MSSANCGKDGRFQDVKEKQAQSFPGKERDMKPPSESTKLEGDGHFDEYSPAGKLKGKKALITGGDSGIGRAIAIMYAKEGADVSIVYLPEEADDAEDTKKQVVKEGKSCLLIAGNLMDNQVCREAIQKHVREYNKLDILVNNASKQMMLDDFSQIDLNEVEGVFKSNIIQMIALTKYAIPAMGPGSSIINTSSTVAFRGSPSLVDYSATKGAIVSFTRSLAKQLVKKGIRVNAVAPGLVHTPLQPASRPPEQMENLGKKTMLGRPIQPSEIAPSFVFLASRDSEVFYGQVLHAYPIGD